MHTLLLLLGLWAAHASVIDRVVVVVDDELVLASEVAFEEALAPLDLAALPFWDPRHKDAKSRLVDAAIIQLRARSVTLYTPEEQKVRDRQESIRAQFEDREAWQAWLTRWGLDEQELRVQLRHRIVVENYLSRNLQMSPLQPGWLEACDALLAELRPTVRIRDVPPLESTP